MTEILKCKITGNPCGTDTVEKGRFCPGTPPCQNCVLFYGSSAWKRIALSIAELRQSGESYDLEAVFDELYKRENDNS